MSGMKALINLTNQPYLKLISKLSLYLLVYKNLKDSDLLTVWLTNKNSYANNELNYLAFLSGQPRNCSVNCVTSLSESVIWQHYEVTHSFLMDTPVKARAQISKKLATGVICANKQVTSVKFDPTYIAMIRNSRPYFIINTRHCNIVIPEFMKAATRKDVLKLLELGHEVTPLRVLAENSSLILRPGDL
jgi:hypothetical protein